MEKIKLIAGVFILLAVIGTTYYIVEGETTYYCEDTNLVGICFKLSKVNDAGISTRCYYNESAPTRYKNCKTGWNEFTEEIIRNISDTDSIGSDIDLEEDKLLVLESLGIGKFEIRNESCKIWNYSEIQTCVNWSNEITNITSNESLEVSPEEWMEIACLEYNITYKKEDCIEIDNSFLGYNQPVIMPCNKINEFECKSKVYQKGGINRDFIIPIKSCIEYNITEIEGECLNWSLNQSNETCLEYQMINVTGDCIDWKILNKDEINSEAIKYAEEEFERIYQITLSRQNRTSELLSDEIVLNIVD